MYIAHFFRYGPDYKINYVSSYILFNTIRFYWKERPKLYNSCDRHTVDARARNTRIVKEGTMFCSI